MKAERLLRHYEKIADAPDAIARLRRFILDLAVRGKLVPQDPTDEPTSELLKRIAREKARLVKAGEARKLEVDPVAPGDEPFVVPPAWTWTRLGSIGDWGSGSTPPRGASGLYGGSVTWLKSGELNDNRALAGSEETVTEAAVSKGSFRLNKPGDVLIAMYGATIGKVAILAESAVTNQAVCGCTPFAGVFNQFLFLFLLSQREQFHSASEGGAHGPRIRIVGEYGSPAFMADYHAALQGRKSSTPSSKASAGTLQWLVDQWKRSSDWASTSSATRRQRENILHHVLAKAGRVGSTVCATAS